MKVTKIDISQELMEIPDGQDSVTFAAVPRIDMRDESNLMQDIQVQKTVYKLVRVYNPVKFNAKIPINFLVKDTELGLMEELLAVTDGELREKLEKVEIETQKMCLKESRHRIQRIRNLPWWKRIFKSNIY